MHRLVLPVLNRVSMIPINLQFFGIDNDTVTSYFVSRYIARKLEMRFRINELFTPIGRDLRYIIRNTAYIRGYKIQFVGRITRRDRVRTSWTLGGNIPMGKIKAFVEHATSLGILRNGICSVRV
jgi:ribosomal protein S3